MIRAARNPLTLAIAVSLWVASVDNWPLWRAVVKLSSMSSLRGMLFVASLCAMIACISLALLALGAWQRSIKPLATLLLVAAAVDANYMGSYPIDIDPAMIINVLHSETHDGSDLVGWRLLLSLALLAGLPSWWVWRTPLRPMSATDQGLHNTAALVLSLCMAGGLLVLNATPIFLNMRNHKRLRDLINPASLFYAESIVLPAIRATSGPASHHLTRHAGDHER